MKLLAMEATLVCALMGGCVDKRDTSVMAVRGSVGRLQEPQPRLICLQGAAITAQQMELLQRGFREDADTALRALRVITDQSCTEEERDRARSELRLLLPTVEAFWEICKQFAEDEKGSSR
jgi:hypothetical protein